MTSYDAVLLLSFGGPEGPEDVIDFLANVTRGRGIPRERLAEVGKHYDHFGGISPINAQNRALISALQVELAARGHSLPIYFGNRNWHPLLAETLAEMVADGVGRALVILTSAYSSYSGCRQYRENLAAAVAEAGLTGQLEVDKVRAYFDHPGFIEPMVQHTLTALGELPVVDGATRLVFSTHSIPVASAARSGPPGAYDPGAGGAYVGQHLAVAELIADTVGDRLGREIDWRLVYQSRSGPPDMPWLEPDISVHLAEISAEGASGAVIVPIGFVSDHMEVAWDLDTVAVADARQLGLPVVRAATVGTDPVFVSGLADLVEERLADTPSSDRPAMTPLGPSHDVCPVGCCANPRGFVPAVCGSDPQVSVSPAGPVPVAGETRG
jgi:ferrochelatase